MIYYSANVSEENQGALGMGAFGDFWYPKMPPNPSFLGFLTEPRYES